MKDLIEALTIFLKYRDERWPTHCEHDVLHIVGVTEEEVTAEDKKRLGELGFVFSDTHHGEPCWLSFRYGSA